MKKILFGLLGTLAALELSGTYTTQALWEDNNIPVPVTVATLSNNRCGVDAYWHFDEATSTMYITGTGEIKFGTHDDGTLAGPQWDTTTKKKVKTLVIGEGITDTGYSQIHGLVNMTKVVLPESLEVLGCAALGDATSLKSVTLPSNLQVIDFNAFRGCSSLESIEIPPSVHTIGESAFTECTSLTHVEIPDTVTKLGSALFRKCTSLTSATLPTLPDATFSGCTSLATYTIPDGVKRIGMATFADCQSLKKLFIPSSVKTIAEGAFSQTTPLESIIYSGTQSQWDAMNIAYESSFNAVLNTVSVYCNGSSTTEPEDLSYHASEWAQRHIIYGYQIGVLEDMEDLYQKWTSHITREEFCRMIMNVYDMSWLPDVSVSESIFHDTNHPDVKAANSLGIVSGKGDGMFFPDATVTRQEIAVMAYRLADKFGQIKDLQQETGFLDQYEIADWAKESVYYTKRQNLLSGSEGYFRPNDAMTCQEAVIICNNLYNYFCIAN